MKHKLAVLGRMVWVLRPQLLSHHPNCSHYDDHVLQIGSARICQGCFFMYGGLAFFIIVWMRGGIPTLKWLDSLAIALLLFIPTVIHTLIGLRFRILRILGRLMLGGTIFFSFYSIFSLEGILRGFIVYAIILFLGVFGLFGSVRMQREVSRCRASCPFDEQLPACRGLRDPISNLVAVRGLKEVFPSVHRSLVFQLQDSMEQPG
ncbi:MAG: hypothetical protein ACXAB4_07310 [Candidatus Hodarchaeales archaeon]